MHTKRIYLIVWTLLILIYKRGYCIDKHECLTWGINSNLLTLICRLNHLFEPVILIDNYEHEYIGCFFSEAINACLSRPKSHNITVDNSTNTVILTIDDVNKKNINGKWKCKQGKNIYETEVSISKGIISTTNLHISGVLLNTRTDSQEVMVTCYSCREPRKNNIEFLINGSSIDSIAYNKNTGHCTHKDGFCKPKDCFCDLSGNEFTRLFSVSSTNVTYFSCYTSFFDNDKKSIFSLNVTILFNDKVFHYIGSETKVLKPPSQNYDEDNRNKSASLNTTRIESSGTDSKRTEIPVILWIVAVVSIIIVLVPPVILSFLCVRNMIIQKKGHQHRPYVDTLSSQTGGSKKVKDDLQGHHNDTTHLLTDFEAIRDDRDFETSVETKDSGIGMDDRDFETSIETRDSGIGMDPSKSKTYENQKSPVLSKDKDVSTNSGTEDPSKSKTYEKQKRLLLSKGKDVYTYSGTEAICMHGDTITYENAKQDIQMETKTFLYSQGNQDTKDKMTDVLHHDKCVQEQTVTNGNRKQDMEMKPIKVSHSPGYTDAIDNMVDVLYIKIGEPNITVETKVDTFLQNRNKMSKKSENDFDQQKEEYTESIHHEIGMEFTNTKGTEREENLKIWCQPCQKTNNNVPACHRCLNCEEAVCECCKEIHSKKHKLEKITPLHNEIIISNWCSNHHDHQYQYFCEDHYRLCCCACMSIDHRDCLIITSIADASKGFKSSEVVEKYKTVLKTISKSFDNLKDIIEQGRNDVNQNTCDVLSDLEMNCHLVFERDELQHFKELFPKHVQDDKNICLSKLQQQLSVVYKCKFFIHTIETSLKRIIQQWHEEQVFRTVHISTKFLASTLKKVISDTESIKLVFNPMSVGDKHVMFGIREKERVITQNLTALLARKRRDEYENQHIITDFRNTPI